LIQNTIVALTTYTKPKASKRHANMKRRLIQVVNYYARLYKAQKTVELLKENQKAQKQRAVDFTALEKTNHPRNDLMKAQLQVSKVQLSLDKAMVTLIMSILNYYHIKIRPKKKTNLIITESDFAIRDEQHSKFRYSGCS
jgi:uncharacterized membrane protein (DUF106 family)